MLVEVIATTLLMSIWRTWSYGNDALHEGGSISIDNYVKRQRILYNTDRKLWLMMVELKLGQKRAMTLLNFEILVKSLDLCQRVFENGGVNIYDL